MEWVRLKKLGRDDVDRLLAVAEAMFSGGPGAASPQVKEALAACASPECGRPVLARGLCVAHYHRARRKKAPPEP